MRSISCKCITYGRVATLEESIHSFLSQKYEGDSELVIVNDYPLQTLIFEDPRVRIFNVPTTFSTIGEKENFAVSMCKYNTIAVWDDDDVALNNHLSNIDKYLENNDLLHWSNGIFMVDNKIQTLTSLGNSGIVYTKKAWETVGRHALENAGYDATFTSRIHANPDLKVINAHPSNNDVSWIYYWGNRSYHMSQEGTDIIGESTAIERHAAHIERLRRAGKIPTGTIVLQPKWSIDYQKLLTYYLAKHD